MTIQAIKGNVYLPHKDWEAREELILSQESKKANQLNIAAEKPDTQLGHPWKGRPKPLKEEDHELKSEKMEIFLPRGIYKKKKKKKKFF